MTQLNSVTDKLITRKEAAQILNSTAGTLAVDDCTRRRDLQPQKKKNGRVYYRLSVIEAERDRQDEKNRLK